MLLLTLALPIRRWRTGETPAPPLPLVSGGPAVDLPRRVWIDTDAACGHARTADPDDCLAILLLARSPEVELVGISTVFGNAPLTILSLGPLTNLEQTLRRRPALAGVRLVGVMGRRPGHVFHPTEGHGAGAILFGHGPVFRDLNLVEDPAAAAAILARRIPTTLIPYEVAREVSVGAADLDRMAAAGGASAWVAGQARGWLEFWRTDVGLAGFYPFDAVAAMYVTTPDLFSCARVSASVGEDEVLGWIGRLIGRSTALLVRAGDPGSTVLYCPKVAASALHRLMAQRLSVPRLSPMP